MRPYILLLAVLFQPLVSFSAEPSLVGHWKLDDKDGETVSDSSAGKNHGKAVHRPMRVTGKVGGAFAFNGKDSYVEIPNAKNLEKIQEGSYAIAVWFKPEIVPPGTEDVLGDGGEVTDMYPLAVQVEPDRLGLALS